MCLCTAFVFVHSLLHASLGVNTLKHESAVKRLQMKDNEPLSWRTKRVNTHTYAYEHNTHRDRRSAIDRKSAGYHRDVIREVERGRGEPERRVNRGPEWHTETIIRVIQLKSFLSKVRYPELYFMENTICFRFNEEMTQFLDASQFSLGRLCLDAVILYQRAHGWTTSCFLRSKATFWVLTRIAEREQR